ncbi:MAG: Hpt domain-containing protein [Gammaproteobacteria bacterium]|nr:Hpt domain-containing protein [Gammaproteobacteria bacterium]
MSDEKKRIFQKRMTALHEKYCKQLPEKYHEIERSWKEYQTDFNNTDFFDAFYRYIHTLKGTAATFGFNTQADICFEVQQVLTQIKDQQASPDESVDIINQHLAKLKAYINTPADDIEE